MATKLPQTIGIKKRFQPSWGFILVVAGLIAFTSLVIQTPQLVAWVGDQRIQTIAQGPFPVTVDPQNKRIVEDPKVEALFDQTPTERFILSALDFFDSLGVGIADSPLYQALALAGEPKLVMIRPGYRKEQVAAVFGDALGWNRNERLAFLKESSSLLKEGMFLPGTYEVTSGMTSSGVVSLIYGNFENHVLSRYATSTEAVVPLTTALTIASLIEREAGDREEMRIISGIIWNRIFSGMKLQIDATLQYARGSQQNGWWPVPRSKDKYISSPYNTYQNAGLPPGPIANPSIAAVVAALNPKNTPCLYYFHDVATSDFYCSPTYEEHVTQLKKIYGRGR